MKENRTLKNKVILVLSDGLQYDAAVRGMGFLEHLVEMERASLYKVIGELPSMSRPMYETIHTGLPAIEHGVVSNRVVRRSIKPSIFEVSVGAGKTTAAAAYYWISELYNRAPYDPVEDCEVDDASLLIQHGRFYTQDDYPDADLFATAGMLVRKFAPDYLLVHPMGMDWVGESYGSNSSEYRNHAIRQDSLLADLIPEWLEREYNVLVTSDHGMNPDKLHGGNTPEVREVPLYLIRARASGQGKLDDPVSQLQIAPTVCELLGAPVPETMRLPPLVRGTREAEQAWQCFGAGDLERSRALS